MKKDIPRLALPVALALLITALTRSFTIGCSVGFLTTLLRHLSLNVTSKRINSELERHLPELIDHIITGIQSGMSLTDSLVSLVDRGPAAFKVYFEEFKIEIVGGSNFTDAISRVQQKVKLASADQVFESLLLAKTIGGTDLIVLLRQLSDFTRSDLAFKEEIQTKQGWIRNSAHLSSVAPWILLVLLSLQPSTAAMYSTRSGVTILATGLTMTSIAYIWMSKLSRLPQQTRIFGTK